MHTMASVTLAQETNRVLESIGCLLHCDATQIVLYGWADIGPMEALSQPMKTTEISLTWIPDSIMLSPYSKRHKLHFSFVKQGALVATVHCNTGNCLLFNQL